MHHLYKSVVCPFYINSNERSIQCEGYCKGTTLRVAFDKKERMDRHVSRYCNNLSGYESCPLNPVIMEQYKEED